MKSNRTGMLGSFWVWSEQSVAPMVFIDFTPFGGFNCHSHVENTPRVENFCHLVLNLVA